MSAFGVYRNDQKLTDGTLVLNFYIFVLYFCFVWLLGYFTSPLFFLYFIHSSFTSLLNPIPLSVTYKLMVSPPPPKTTPNRGSVSIFLTKQILFPIDLLKEGISFTKCFLCSFLSLKCIYLQRYRQWQVGAVGSPAQQFTPRIPTTARAQTG